MIKIPILNIELRYLPIMSAMCGTAFSVITNLSTISKGGKGKNGSSVAVSKYFLDTIYLPHFFLMYYFIFKEFKHCISGVPYVTLFIFIIFNCKHVERRPVWNQYMYILEDRSLK